MGRIAIVSIVLLFSLSILAQDYGVDEHPNNRKKAIVKNGNFISDHVYSEISSFSENKAYVAKGGLYAYVDSEGTERTPYMFAVANDFVNGYAIVGDSTGLGLLDSQFKVVMPFMYQQVLHPKKGFIIVQSQEGTWGVLNTSGKELLPCIYDIPPRLLKRNKFIVRLEDGFGVVNYKNEVLCNTSYEYITKDGFGYKDGIRLRLFKPNGSK